MSTPPADEQGRAVPSQQPVKQLQKDGDVLLTPKDWIDDVKIVTKIND